MNAPMNLHQLLPDLSQLGSLSHTTLSKVADRHLDALEEEAIFILREVAGAFERPGLLFRAAKIRASSCTWQRKRSSAR
ncbi:hypothetical protein LepocDRAFT_00001600 [Leptothrix ochracea L12]|uniref:Uncharacterized protein n=1 Tax=Leptothrix ochracea L12 TaxID=735332 RepID=I4Z5E0_9BURK|nr:hypothetical protein LepocDRAFT_00001600 [Leptothrix ochracea L12]